MHSYGREYLGSTFISFHVLLTQDVVKTHSKMSPWKSSFALIYLTLLLDSVVFLSVCSRQIFFHTRLHEKTLSRFRISNSVFIFILKIQLKHILWWLFYAEILYSFSCLLCFLTRKNVSVWFFWHLCLFFSNCIAVSFPLCHILCNLWKTIVIF